MFLLDTNVLPELQRRQRISHGVAAWADNMHSTNLFVSAITILEIEAGTLAKREVKSG
jgi:predicted nucleic acid-binding protein